VAGFMGAWLLEEAPLPPQPMKPKANPVLLLRGGKRILFSNHGVVGVRIKFVKKKGMRAALTGQAVVKMALGIPFFT